MTIRRGRFVTLEGGEGVGKSTQAHLLAERLRQRGMQVVETREPGGTPDAEAIRDLLLRGSPDRWSARSESLLFAAARCDHVEKLIDPALERGAWVICDRYLDSSRAYQSADGELTDAQLLCLHRIGARLVPDLTLLLTLKGDQAAARSRARDGSHSDRIGGRDDPFFRSVERGFERIAALESERVRIVSAEGTREEVGERLLAVLAELF